MTPEDKAFAALKTRLAPRWRRLTSTEARLCCEGDRGCRRRGHLAHTPKFILRFYCESCARARGAFLVEVIEKGDKS